MIFGRKKKARAEEEPEDATTAPEATDEAADEPDADETDAAETDATDADDTDEAAAATDDDADPSDGDASDSDEACDLDVEALDSTEWRHGGPFEVSELGDAAESLDDADTPRIDLGSIVISPVPGSELRLQVNEAQEIVSAMLVLPIHGPATGDGEPEVVSSSALELSAYAAPRSGGLWAELRDEISQSALESGGSAELAAGPFGMELRRLLPVTTPSGEQGYQPSRMWVAEGPRWLLRGIVYGQAAIEADDEDPAVTTVLAAFRDVVVRRGDEAMAPGDLLPMSIPDDLQPADQT